VHRRLNGCVRVDTEESWQVCRVVSHRRIQSYVLYVNCTVRTICASSRAISSTSTRAGPRRGRRPHWCASSKIAKRVHSPWWTELCRHVGRARVCVLCCVMRLMRVAQQRSCVCSFGAWRIAAATCTTQSVRNACAHIVTHARAVRRKPTRQRTNSAMICQHFRV
jgi:hypothetical protein